jgi:hypothetical protein
MNLCKYDIIFLLYKKYIKIKKIHVLKIYINSSETADGVNVPTSVNKRVINSGGV